MIAVLSPRYRRNLLTFGQNSSLLNQWTLFTLLMSCIIALPMLGVAKAFFTPISMFWIHNLFYFGFIDLFHGVILPLAIISIPSEPKENSSEKKSFFVRTSLILEPRRPRSSKLVPFKLGSTIIKGILEHQEERKDFCILTPLGLNPKKVLHDKPPCFPLQAPARHEDIWQLSSQAEMAEVEDLQCNDVKAKASPPRKPSIKSARPQLLLSLHYDHPSFGLPYNHLLDPMDFQHMVRTIIRYHLIQFCF